MPVDNKIIDVAKRAGVSAATVSRVLNDSPLVTDKTKQKVLKVIEEMDYHPNAAAKHLRSQKTMTLGIIVPDINNSYFAEIIKGVENAAYAHKYKVIICDSDNRPEKELEYIGLLPNRTVDAMILVAPFMPGEVIDDYAAKGHLIGLVGRTVTNERVPSVTTDNVHFSSKVVQHLIKQGHRQIAFIGGYADSDDNYERMEGYMKALRDYKVPFHPGLIENGDFEEKRGYEAFVRLLEKKIPFTSVFTANDEIALGVYKACREREIRIPEDLAVVGVDNNRISNYLLPPLSTVEQPKYAMGTRIAEKLIAELNNMAEEQRETIMESTLLIRGSSLYDRDRAAE